MKLNKESLELLYETMGRVCLASQFMSREDKAKISNLIEKIIQIFKSYEVENEDI